MSLPKPVARVGHDPILYATLDSLRDQAKAESEATLKGEQSKWMMPLTKEEVAAKLKTSADEGWDGDMSNFQDMEKPFDRKQTGEWFVDATKDPTSPGTTGDLIVAVLQSDYLGIMERSFRARHTMSRARAMCHAMGRKRGHGDGTGPLSKSVRDYISSLIKETRK